MELIKASLKNLLELQQICIDSYSLIFANHWVKNGMDLYLNQEFGTERLKSDLTNHNYEYYLIKKEGENIGFLKVNYKSGTLSELANCELDKIYILPKYSGMGIGKIVMNRIIKRVRDKGKEIFFLCVIDSNHNSIAFYKSLGFKFHSKTRLEALHFKEELRGMNRMCFILKKTS